MSTTPHHIDRGLTQMAMVAVMTVGEAKAITLCGPTTATRPLNSMRFMISERQDESIAAPRTSARP